MTVGWNVARDCDVAVTSRQVANEGWHLDDYVAQDFVLALGDKLDGLVIEGSAEDMLRLASRIFHAVRDATGETKAGQDRLNRTMERAHNFTV